MNIKILDSWLRDYLKTDATPVQIAEKLSLTSVSVERVEKYNNDYLYDIEVTTNRPDLMSVVGLAREAAAVLPQNGIAAGFNPPKLVTPKGNKIVPITIKNDASLVNRICAVVMEVKIGTSPKEIQTRLESTGIRSLNNLIDITNYVMRVIGHPTHVFDYDRLPDRKIIIRESKKGEKIRTLDKKEYTLPGGDVVAEDGKGTIIDLLGVMGLENSVVTDNTKRILFFIDNVDSSHIRKSSMSLSIRTEAAILNEKTPDPQLAMEALLFGIKLYEELANGKIISEIIDDFPKKIKSTTITVSEQRIRTIIGVPIQLKKSAEILTALGFEAKIQRETIVVLPPSYRSEDTLIEEDIIEEIARVFGYHNIPSKLPALMSEKPLYIEKSSFYWIDRVKDALKYWGFTEIYSYSMVSEEMYEGSLSDAITLQNPLSEEFTYMRRTLIPSLLKVIHDNKNREIINIFEIANVYQNKQNGLPEQYLKLAGVIKKPGVTFFQVKGLLEQLFTDLGIENVAFKQEAKEASQTEIFIDKHPAGTIEVLSNEIVDFELDFETIIKHATLKKKFQPTSKYPPIVEDLSIIASGNVLTGDLIDLIKKQSNLIISVELFDKYQDTRTFHIIFQSYEKNLTTEEVEVIRKKVIKILKEKYNAKLKE